MGRIRGKLTYANVVSTLALFLVLSGGAAVAAKKVRTNDIKPRSIKTKLLAPKAVKSGKIAPQAVKRRHIAFNAVNGPRIAPGSVGESQLVPDAVTGAKVRDGSLTPADVLGGASVVTTAVGGGVNITATESKNAQTIPLSDSTWMQGPTENNLFLSRVEATLRAKPMSTCILEMITEVDGDPVGAGSATTAETETVSVVSERDLSGARVATGQPRPHELSVRVYSAGNACETIRLDSVKIVVIGVG